MKVKEFLKNLWQDESGQYAPTWLGLEPAKKLAKKAAGYVSQWAQAAQTWRKPTPVVPSYTPYTYRGAVQTKAPAPRKQTTALMYPTTTKSTYIPGPQYTPQKTIPQKDYVEEWQQQQPTGVGGYQPFDFSRYMSQFQPSGWEQPTLPQEPQVTAAMIREWQERARTEAGLQFEPQILKIQQELEKMLLGTEEAKGGIAPAYQKIEDYVKKWQEEETGATQRRYYARGLGRGGGLTEREGEIAEQALKETTAAGTEMARKLSDIESQKLLMMEQAGAKKEEIEVQRGRYVAARSADLEESYRQNQRQLDQQRFTNQMNIAQVGMTKESEDFNRWLGTMNAANEIWYREQTLGLEQQSLSLSAAAQAEARLYEEQHGLKPGDPGTIEWYRIKQVEEAEKPETLSAGELRDLYGQAFTNRYSGWTPTSQRQYLSGMGVPDETVSNWIKKLYGFSGITSESAGAMGGTFR